MKTLTNLQKQITTCTKCPRLVAWREQMAREKVKRFAEDKYWGKPLPSFGDPQASLLIVGLAPAAHGGNRTGRMFTGDRSGDWLFRALHKAGFANQPNSAHRDDGLKLTDCYITATLRCAPPQNKPAPEEIANCRPFLLREIELLKNVRVILGLGKIGFDNALSAFAKVYDLDLSPRPKFGHGVEYTLNSKLTLMGTFHPSQQNTFTGKLTAAMFDRIFRRVQELLRQNNQY
ncbi:uracil-DNA glycosylase [candidate division KSB1 bacterium]|nr:uracil-DNA glycosylase [candidate division KSB1 bacterium]